MDPGDAVLGESAVWILVLKEITSEHISTVCARYVGEDRLVGESWKAPVPARFICALDDEAACTP